jgi:hypothetical protein
MSEEPNHVELLSDPLSSETRKERRNLLAASVVGFIVATMNVIPTRISALGIELPSPARNYFLYIVIAVTVYFMVAFVVYGTTDYFTWRHKKQEYLTNLEVYMDDWGPDDQRAQDLIDERVPRVNWLYDWMSPVARIRVGFEFALPIVIGFVVIALLTYRASHPVMLDAPCYAACIRPNPGARAGPSPRTGQPSQDASGEHVRRTTSDRLVRLPWRLVTSGQ